MRAQSTEGILCDVCGRIYAPDNSCEPCPFCEAERLRQQLALCLGLIRDRSRLTYGWDDGHATQSYYIDGKPYSIHLYEAIAMKAAEAEEEPTP